MKIGLVTACYKPVTNGVTRMVAGLATALVGLGHSPTVFTLGPPQAIDQMEPFPVWRSPAWSLGNSGYYGVFQLSKATACRLAQMDILHTHHPIMCLEMVARLRLNRPVVFTNHTRYDLYLPLYLPLLTGRPAAAVGHWLTRLLWPKLVNLADTIIAPTPAIKALLEGFGVHKPILVIPNGIHLPAARPALSPEMFGWTPDDTILIFVGRLAAEKNLETMIDLFAAAYRAKSGLRLLIVGGGPDFRRLQLKIDRLNLGHAACLVGEVPSTEISAYLEIADLFLTASFSEVDPLTIIEAMASGLPVVAFNSTWTKDCLPEEGAWLADNHDQYIANLVSAACQIEERLERGIIARSFAREKTIQANARLTLGLYHRLLSKK